MIENIHQEVHEDLGRSDPERLAFTQRAITLLPIMQRPSILDVGCGRGDPTLELARLTDGVIIAIDIDQASLAELKKRADEQGMADRIQTLNCSIHHMTFQDQSFDVIWAEASIHIKGFEKGLDDWRRFLKHKGFLGIHEMAWLHPEPPEEIATHWQRRYPGIRTVPEYLTEIKQHGYAVVDHFALPDDFWWHHYYGPLERRIAQLREKYCDDRKRLEQLALEQREVDLYKKYPGWYGTAFIIMQKREM